MRATAGALCGAFENGARPTSEFSSHFMKPQCALGRTTASVRFRPDYDITFGLMHTIEKAAQIYMLAITAGGGKIRQTITDDNLRAIAKEFGVELNEEF